MGTTRYAYLKREPKPVIRREFKVPHRVAGAMSGFFFVVGLLLLSAVAWPMVQWQLFYLPRQPQEFASPIARFASPLAGPTTVAAEEPESATATTGGDMTQAQNWFPKADAGPVDGNTVRYYTLSVPKLRIEDATVEFGGTNLKKNLIGWATSSLPGNLGNNIIFGHSALPQFYSPKNYSTIFSLLPTLEKGDEILINYDGVSYKYEIFDMQTVDPEDYSVLEQRYDDSYVTLITCVPPGTYWKRLVVRARLTKY